MGKVKRIAKEQATTDDQLDFFQDKSVNPYWQSSLFNETYLLKDEPLFNGDVPLDEVVAYDQFVEQFKNFCEEFKNEKPENWSERTTINRFIKPMLLMLGYKSSESATVEPWLEDESFSYQESTGKNSYKPDFIIVDNHKFLKHIQDKGGQEKINMAKDSVFLTIEAKYWGRIDEYYKQNKKEDSKRADKKDLVDSAKGMDFDDQCLKYMEMLNKQYGILTDGRTWRLYNLASSTPSFHPHFQFNLGSLIRDLQRSDINLSSIDHSRFVENLKYFYFIFRKKALFNESGEELFVDELLRNNKKYVTQVQEDLKDRFVSAMTLACNGFNRASKSNSIKSEKEFLRDVSESFIFNILFLRFCESRGILPIKQNPMFRLEASVSNILDRIEGYRPEWEEDGLNNVLLKKRFKEFSYSGDGYQIHDRLIKLTKLVQDGSHPEIQGFSIKGFKKTIFAADEWSFIQKNKLTNQEVIRIIFEVCYADSDDRKGHFQQIPFNSFSPRQLGSLYESFLEYKLDKAESDMAFIDKQWQEANLESDKIKKRDVPKVRKGFLFFTPDKQDRKDSGSYYTPDCVVQYIVKETLDPLVAGRKSHEILNLKVCDPSMGSGHFLSASLNYLSRKYYEALDKETNDDLHISLATVKKEILHNCIYGVDLKARPVKLAKMCLWLESASANSELEELDDQIKCANSLTDEQLWKKEWKFLSNGIDAIVGNPPYLGEKGHKDIFQEVEKSWLGQRFYQGKMDLLYFFFHLGIDLLKDQGRLGFITTNYYITADGALTLRKDLFERTHINKLVNLNEMKVFGEASGQHNLITFLSKGVGLGDKTCQIDSKESSKCDSQILNEVVLGLNKSTKTYFRNKDEVFTGEELNINFTPDECSSLIHKIFQDTKPLEEYCNVNSGIQTGADKVTEAHLRKFKSIKAKKGDGVFILSNKEITSMGINKSDPILKNFFKNSDVFKFGCEKSSDEKILYVSREHQNLSPEILDHLKKYKPILENKREVKTGQIPWFQLHWPREKAVFLSEKIVCPQRSRLNTFGYTNNEWHASVDVYFITSKDQKTNLKYILGLINSKIIYSWLYYRGKRKGEALELYASPVLAIPIKLFENSEMKNIIKIVDKLIGNPQSEKYFNELNNEFYRLFKFSKSEIAFVEDLYNSHSKYSDLVDEAEDDEAA